MVLTCVANRRFRCAIVSHYWLDVRTLPPLRHKSSSLFL